MTRDESRTLIKNLIAVMNDGGLDWERRADLVTDRFEQLGMLKLDDPKSAEQKAIDSLWNKTPGVSPGRILAWLNDSGLKIVEK